MDNRFLSEHACGPGDASAVVAVGCGKKGRLPELLFERIAGECIKGHVRDIVPRFFCDETCHRKGTAKHLERIESEAEALVLDEEAPDAERLGTAGERCERRDVILREGTVKGAGTVDLCERHDGKIRIVTVRHMIAGPSDRIHDMPPADNGKQKLWISDFLYVIIVAYFDLGVKSQSGDFFDPRINLW